MPVEAPLTGGEGFGRDRLASRVLRRADGRLRSGWRLGIFVVLFLLLLFPLDLLALWLSGEWALAGPLPPFRVAALVVAALAASWLMMERWEGAPLGALGIAVGPGWLREVAGGAALGGMLMALALAFLAAAGWLSWRPGSGGGLEHAAVALGASSLLLGAAFAEELLFRGYPLQVLAEGMGGPAAILVSSALFCAVHVPNIVHVGGEAGLEAPGLGALFLGNIFVAGLLLGLAYWRTYSLWFATGIHFGWNWMMGVAVGLPVSGIGFGLPAYDAVLRGAAVWTGGDFGPEGGLAASLVACAGLLWLGRTKRLSRSLAVLSLRPLPDRRNASGGARGLRG